MFSSIMIVCALVSLYFFLGPVQSMSVYSRTTDGSGLLLHTFVGNRDCQPESLVAPQVTQTVVSDSCMILRAIDDVAVGVVGLVNSETIGSLMIKLYKGGTCTSKQTLVHAQNVKLGECINLVNLIDAPISILLPAEKPVLTIKHETNKVRDIVAGTLSTQLAILDVERSLKLTLSIPLLLEE
eukprot:Awhi_evm1s12807